MKRAEDRFAAESGPCRTRVVSLVALARAHMVLFLGPAAVVIALIHRR